MPKQNETFFALCPRGLEAVLGTEFEQLGAQDVTVLPGGVSFTHRLVRPLLRNQPPEPNRQSSAMDWASMIVMAL